MAAAGFAGAEGGTKLYISNLDHEMAAQVWNHGRGRGRGYGLGQSIDTGIVRICNVCGRGCGPGGKQIVRKTAEDLDKELETYHAGAMDTSFTA